MKFESELTMIATEGIDFIEVESPDDANTQQIEGVEKSPNQVFKYIVILKSHPIRFLNILLLRKTNQSAA